MGNFSFKLFAENYAAVKEGKSIEDKQRRQYLCEELREQLVAHVYNRKHADWGGLLDVLIKFPEFVELYGCMVMRLLRKVYLLNEADFDAKADAIFQSDAMGIYLLNFSTEKAVAEVLGSLIVDRMHNVPDLLESSLYDHLTSWLPNLREIFPSVFSDVSTALKVMDAQNRNDFSFSSPKGNKLFNVYCRED